MPLNNINKYFSSYWNTIVLHHGYASENKTIDATLLQNNYFFSNIIILYNTLDVFG